MRKNRFIVVAGFAIAGAVLVGEASQPAWAQHAAGGGPSGLGAAAPDGTGPSGLDSASGTGATNSAANASAPVTVSPPTTQPNPNARSGNTEAAPLPPDEQQQQQQQAAARLVDTNNAIPAPGTSGTGGTPPTAAGATPTGGTIITGGTGTAGTVTTGGAGAGAGITNFRTTQTNVSNMPAAGIGAANTNIGPSGVGATTPNGVGTT